jgi:hypothetical protein
MNLRFVPTPLDAPISLPEPRSGGIEPALSEAFIPSAARDAALARLRQPNALVVTTGQQPGLFTGPLYTVHKALSTAALARVLERQWRRPVVPVFWAAGDDHDFAEASQAAWLDGNGSVVTASLTPRPPDAPLTPMSRWARSSRRRSGDWLAICPHRNSANRLSPGCIVTTIQRQR